MAKTSTADLWDAAVVPAAERALAKHGARQLAHWKYQMLRVALAICGDVDTALVVLYETAEMARYTIVTRNVEAAQLPARRAG